jgi:hypothetical protein
MMIDLGGVQVMMAELEGVQSMSMMAGLEGMLEILSKIEGMLVMIGLEGMLEMRLNIEGMLVMMAGLGGMMELAIATRARKNPMIRVRVRLGPGTVILRMQETTTLIPGTSTATVTAILMPVTLCTPLEF